MSYYFQDSHTAAHRTPPPIAPKNDWFDWLQRHWFRVSLVVLVLIGLYKRDWSLSWRTQSKPKVEQSAKNERPNGFTQAAPAPAVAEAKTEDIPLNIGGLVETMQTQRNEKATASDLATLTPDAVKAYLQRFGKVAVQERQKFGIPASVILAVGLKASFAGKRNVTLSSNNHFALPATTDWRGEKEVVNGTSYRRYANAWQSFRDHSLMLTSGKYASIKQKLKVSEYKSWAKALQDVGYPEGNNKLAADLVRLIDRYELYRFDTAQP